LITECNAVSAQRELSTTDYEAVSDDGIFVKSLRDSYPEITDEEIADELFKATIELRYYNRSDETAVHDATSGRQLLQQEENNKVFSEQLEAQRHEIVETVEDINDIGGASISSEMKIFAA
jgi:predicted transcriptional regulator